MRLTLFGEIVTMAFDTVRTNKMRSALTVLGVVIGITSIVGMTSMIRGFDQSLREMIGAMVDDVLAESNRRLKECNPQGPEDIRAHHRQVVAFSDPMRKKVDELRDFLFERMYRHYKVARLWLKVERIVTDLFTAFTNNYRLLPDNWQRQVEQSGGLTNDKALARCVCDYIAGMTDRYAIKEHERLFDLYDDLR